MKLFKAFAFTLIAAFALSSCNNIEKILPKKDGLWNVKSTHVIQTTDGTVEQDTIMYDQGTMMFNSDGTGVMTQDTSSSDFTWSYDKDADVVAITQDSLTIDNNVLESSSKAQSWQYQLSFEFFGSTTTLDVTTELERAE